MSQDLQFDQLADKVHRAWHQDGLLDLLIAWIMLTFGVGEATHYAFRWLPLFLLPVVLYWPVKRWLALPRFGYVEFLSTHSRQLLLRVAYPLAWCLGLPIILLTIVPLQGTHLQWLIAAQGWLRESWTLVIGLAVVIALGLLGWGMRIPRLYAYAGLCLAIVLGSRLFDLPAFVLFLALAAVILAVGVILLIRFLRNYPAAAKGS